MDSRRNNHITEAHFIVGNRSGNSNQEHDSRLQIFEHVTRETGRLCPCSTERANASLNACPASVREASHRARLRV